MGGGVRGRVLLHDGFKQIISIDNLLLAWQEFIKGKRQKPDVQEFQIRLMDNILILHKELSNHTYKHGGYQEFRINDPKPRIIHKAGVRDRLLHHAVYRQLYPFFDRIFISDSFSCRNNKGVHRAVNRFRQFTYVVSKNDTRACWILKCDIRKFFHSIDQHILMRILEERVQDKSIIGLVQGILSSFHSGKAGKGLPLGNLTSQLFCNIYMNELDQFVKHRLKIKHYIRYADDFVVLAEDKIYLETLLVQIKEFLKTNLKLEIHPEKVFIKTLASGIDFLGWVHFPDHRVLRNVTRKRIFKNMHEDNIVSYVGLLSHGNTNKIRNKVISLQKK